MMFRVNLYFLSSCRDEMLRNARKMREEIYQLDGCIQSLRGLSGMSQVLTQLNAARSQMEAEESQILFMLQAIDRICSTYETAENRICENGEMPIFNKWEFTWPIRGKGYIPDTPLKVELDFDETTGRFRVVDRRGD